MKTSALLIELNKTINHRPIRDLAWCLLQAPLFDTRISQHYPGIQLWPQHIARDELIQWLHSLDREPELLLEHLKQQRATRLGIYFEQLLSFYFAEYPRFALVAKNLQVNDNKRTIGEYDFIVLDQADKQHYHIEVAIKFYVGLPTLDVIIDGNTPLHNWHHWVGPNKKDSLSIKMQHLMRHQLPLSTTLEGQATLKEINVDPENLQQRLLLSGRLYMPLQLDNKGTRIEPPTYTAYQTEHLTNWIDTRRLEDFIGDHQDYIILPRQQWMAELTYGDINTFDLEVLSSKQLLAALDNESQTPVHVAKLATTPNKNVKGSIEKERFFYLPEA